MRYSINKKNTLIFVALALIVTKIVCLCKTIMRLKDIRKKYPNCVFFSGQESSYNGVVYEGSSLAVAFSGLVMDFRGAIIKNSATLDLYGEYSGIRIIVPKKWRVKIEGTSKMSGISNRSEFKKKKKEKDNPLLIIKHNLKCSGLEVKNETVDEK